ncbi:uncharacterized protein LOC125041451 [Penaeus chinensis]|uniref:uncharacterized protein LOC125041451 n=1 Tax=Penaeus chinensis TaxID=139456 RepID=UPI001FB631C2|nr:uncharacterized protein LOC125041451 [Penaeus chinensis]
MLCQRRYLQMKYAVPLKTNPTYQAVSNAVKTSNWRSSLTAQYHKIKDELTLKDNLLLRGIDKLVEESVKKCLACQACAPAKQHLELMQNSKLPSEPWSEVSVDFLSGLPNNTYLLVIMDDYSKFPEVEIVNSTSAKAVLPKMDAVFARHGIPAILKSGNRPPFSSEDICKYAQHSDFVHRKLTPLWPQANGEIEHFMGPLMKCVRAAHVECRSWKQELYRYLRQYRATPHDSIGVSPAEALFGRKIRTTLPSVTLPIISRQKIHDKIQETDSEKKRKSKNYTDSRRHTKLSGDRVLVKQKTTKKVQTPFSPRPLKITQCKGYMITAACEDYSITRNASHFKLYSGNATYTQHQDEDDATDDLHITTDSPPTQAVATPLKPCLWDSARTTRAKRLPVRFDEFVGLPQTLSGEKQ